MFQLGKDQKESIDTMLSAKLVSSEKTVQKVVLLSFSDLSRHYTSAYRYVGGYYGGCSEEAMMKALVENGPLSVSFEVYDDFMMYKTGVYHHTGALKSKQAGGSFDPFEVNFL